MLPPSTPDSERGSATIEFLVAGLVLLVPLVYLVIALGLVQNASLGAAATARFIARELATGSDVPPEVVRDMVADGYDLDPTTLDIDITCVPATTQCPTAGATVTVTVRDGVTLPLMPDIFGAHLAVPVTGTATYRVERLAT